MNNFFGSKLNTVLLVVLIVLMAFALRIMTKNPSLYFGFLHNKATEKAPDNTVDTTITGRKDDLVSFSITPGSKVHGIVSYTGSIKGGYFFEANIVMHILDSKKMHVVETHGTSTSDWMTTDPVSFGGTLDFTTVPKGQAYIEIHNDNPSGLPQNEKSIQIPVIVE